MMRKPERIYANCVEVLRGVGALDRRTVRKVRSSRVSVGQAGQPAMRMAGVLLLVPHPVADLPQGEPAWSAAGLRSGCSGQNNPDDCPVYHGQGTQERCASLEGCHPPRVYGPSTVCRRGTELR